MTTSTPIQDNARTQRHPATRVMPRGLLVVGALALTGVSIDLFRGAPASALSTTTAQVQALSAPPLDHSAVTRSAEEPSLELGASIAAYDSPAGEDPSPAPAAAVPPSLANDALDPGSSIGAYER